MFIVCFYLFSNYGSDDGSDSVSEDVSEDGLKNRLDYEDLFGLPA